MFPSLNPAPLGLDALAPEMDEGPEIEVQIENPDGVLVGMDGIEIDLMEIVAGDKSDDFDANLAEEMDEGELQKVASGMRKERNLGLELVECFLQSLPKQQLGSKAKRSLRRSRLKALLKRKSLVPLIVLKKRLRNVSGRT